MFPAIAIKKVSQSPVIVATVDGELVSPEGSQEGENTCHPAATRLQPLPMVSPEGTQDVKTGYWPQITELTEIILLICCSVIWGQYPVFTS